VSETLAHAAKRVLPIAQLGARRLLGRKSPFQVTFSLTNRCNFRCEYCHIPLQHRDEMTTTEWFGAIDEFCEGGMARASLIGGEPLLRKDAGDLIAHLKRRGVHAAMNTNGWFVPERIDDVAKLDVACITLDGPADVNDRQRHKGSYDRAVRAIELLKGRGVQVVTMTVVTPSGADNMKHVLEVARDMDIKAFFQLEHDASCDVHAPIAPHLTDHRIAELADRLLEWKDAGWPVGNSKPLLEMQKRDGRRLGGNCDGCYAGRYYAYVLSDGTVAPCLLTQWQQDRGNGRKLGFLRAFHEMAPPTGPGCACVPIHEVNRMLDFDMRVLWNALDTAIVPALRQKLSR
jgi:MoaA/NifB/PqqE/SkfB family radical SAM enzyme